MPRKLQRPTVTPLNRAEGRVVFRVLGTVAGRQIKRILPTREEAEMVAAELWSKNSTTGFQMSVTRLNSDELRDAEAFVHILQAAKIPIREGALWLIRNYRRNDAPPLSKALDAFLDARGAKGLSDGQFKNLKGAANSFREFMTTRHDDISLVTTLDVETWLARWSDSAAKTYNEQRNSLNSFFRWAHLRKWITDVPTAPIELRKVESRLPTTLRPDAAAKMMASLECDAPDWVPYFALALFAGVRPGVREGEAERMHEDLKQGRKIFQAEGFDVSGKNGSWRFVRWSWCGPLQQWLKAYPPGKGLFPTESYGQAERILTGFRERYGLSPDIMRHTAASCMLYSGMNLAEVALALDNSERILKTNYIGRWSREDTAHVYGILPRPQPVVSLGAA